MKQQLNLPSDPRSLLDKVLALRAETMSEARAAMVRWLPNISRHSFRADALNLAVYLALRRRDLRDLQQELMLWGLTTPGSSPIAVIAHIDSVINTLSAICDQSAIRICHKGNALYSHADWRLEQNTVAVLGSCRVGRATHIMVTLPLEAAVDYSFVKRLVECGMSVARINCAYGSREVWDAMVNSIHRAEQETGTQCKILMDLCGIKPRIASLLLSAGEGCLHIGDTFLLTKELPRQSDFPVAVTSTLPEIIDFLRIGDSVMIDDGKMEAEVVCLVPGGAIIKIMKASQKGSRLKLKKGLNFPRTTHSLPPLTSKDLTDLDYALCKADIIGYSFVKGADDIAMLQGEMEKRVGCRARGIPIVAKIETSQAVDNLPEIIVQGASRQPFSVMIARGDLAVEIGYERLSSLQEEILWCAKATHIPAIWATQVLENLVKHGIPSRAEITDAAMSARAECIMLNKGPFLAETVTFLDNFLAKK